ncbi:ferritin [Athalassotoga sp.]|uniref:ferritin n=1 Tax=Athalassotoga sp. TaxID=2022597 RepID=UPI003D0297EA
MLSKKIEDVLNEQINAELYSAYLYVSMGAYFRSVKLNGFAAWMENQAKEEEEHAKKIYDYVNKRSGRVALKLIKEPPFEWKSPMDVFEDTYVHEQEVTKSIERLTNLSDGEKDYATSSFLQWFVDEQVEEEYSVLQILERLRMIKDSNQGLLMLDAELGKRG